MGHLKERLSFEQKSVLKTYTQYDLEILEYSPFHIRQPKFSKLSIDQQRKEILDGLSYEWVYTYKAMGFKHTGCSLWNRLIIK